MLPDFVRPQVDKQKLAQKQAAEACICIDEVNGRSGHLFSMTPVFNIPHLPASSVKEISHNSDGETL